MYKFCILFYLTAFFFFSCCRESNPTWDEDIKNDVIEECRNHGGALHVHVDRNSPEGNVYVKCPSLTAAAATVRVLHGRYFAGNIYMFIFLSNTFFFQV